MKTILFILILSSISLFADSTKTIIKKNENKNISIIKYETKKFSDLLNTIVNNYADTVDIKKSTEKAYKALLKSLDSQSNYFNKEEYKSINEQTTGDLKGIGLSFVVDNNTPKVYQIIKNSQADSMGINEGYELLKINNTGLGKNAKSTIDSLIKGENLTYVDLLLKDLKGNKKTYKLQRKSILVNSVKASFLLKNTDIAYLKLYRFTKHTFEEISTALRIMKAEGMKKLVFDLRQNTGGVLDAAYQCASLFLDSNMIVTNTQALNPKFSIEYKTKIRGEFFKTPIIILIDEKSASASEIFTASLQENDLSLVVGSKSFGKGSVQNTWTFKDGSAFRMTVAKYLTPLGRSFEKTYDTSKKEAGGDMKLNNSKKTINKITSLLNQYGGKSVLDIKRTKKGRMIINENGIHPDKFISKDTLTLLTKVLKNKKIFHTFAYQYLIVFKDSLNLEYKNGIDFSIRFKITNQMIQDFADYCFRKGFFKKEMFLKDKNYIIFHLKARIASAIWGENAYYYNEIQPDSQIIMAVKSFDELSEILNSK